MSEEKISFDFETVEQYMKRAAIGSGYMEKPCLNPLNPSCPDTAPNKNSSQPPDVGAILSGGCYGYAAKHMHWPEELIVGGAKRNRSGHLRKARALQSVVKIWASEARTLRITRTAAQTESRSRETNTRAASRTQAMIMAREERRVMYCSQKMNGMPGDK